MTILSIVCTKLLCTNAHLGRRVADHHFKVYIRGSRNGIAILDSDKTLICLRNALHFIGSLSRQKGRFFFLKTNHLFYLEIMEEMVSYLRSYLRNVNSHCFDDSQWKIGAFLTNSFANKKKFRSRKKKIHFGLNQQPDCVVILNADRKSSVILEADRSQIPILSLGDSTIPWESYKRITYPIPSRDTIEIVYFFCHLIMKTVIIEQKAMTVETKSRIKKTNSTFPRGTMVRGASSSTSSPKRGRGNYYCIWRLLFTLAAVVVATVFLQVDPSFFASDQARELLIEWIISLSQSAYHILRAILEETWNGRERCAPMGGTELESPSRSGEETYKAPHVHLMLSSDSDSDSVNQGGGSDLSIDLSRTAECQEHIRQYAETIKDFRIDEQFESFKNDEFTKPLYEQLCAYVGDADAVKNECLREISENFDSTDAGLIDFVKQTDTSEGQRVVIFDLIKLHFLDELDKLPPELQLNANSENESSSEDDSDEDE
jgi:ribosomal protein S2